MRKTRKSEQLYQAARKQEKEEFFEALKEFKRVVGSWKQEEDEDGDKIVPYGLYTPRISCTPKHAEGYGDYEVVAIDGNGFLDLDDGYDVWENESYSAVEYGHLLYVTEFMWGLISGHLRDKIKDKLLEKGGRAEINCCINVSQRKQCYRSELEFPTSYLEIVDDEIIVHSDKNVCDYTCKLEEVYEDGLWGILGDL